MSSRRPGIRVGGPLVVLIVLVLILATTGAGALAQTRPSDIRGHWAEGRIATLLDRRIVALGPDRRFHPHRPVTRAQFVGWLVAARGLPKTRTHTPAFPDLAGAGPWAGAVETAAVYGIIPRDGPFRPQEALQRAQAFVWMVRALGHTFEAGHLANAPLPFRDADGLSHEVRGAIGVLALSAPPILREPRSTRVRPNDAMTRAEAASLIWAYLQAMEQGMALGLTAPLHTGVTLVLEKRGVLRTLPFWRVQVGAFQDEERAQRLAEQMRSRGLPAVVEPIDEWFKVRVGNFVTREEATALQQRLAGEGLITWAIQTVADYETLDGPFWTGAVVIEPAAGARLRPALAGEGMGRARTSEAARRTGAVAATNGGFFGAGGDPLGCLVVDGEVLSEPMPHRTCAGITEDGQLLFDVLRLDGAADGEAGTVPIDGVNRVRGPNEIVAYRPAFGASTRTNAAGAEVIVAGDVVQQVLDGRGNAAIPAGGYVLSGHGRGRAALLAAFRPGDRVSLRLRLVPASGDPRWNEVRHVIGGGPRLLADGQYVGGEGFRPSLTDRRHPRTALGRLADGRIVLVVVGGRQPYHSLGMTLAELAALLRRMGATDALNLDGGGSTTLVVRGVVVNLPADEAGERPVSDVLLVLPPTAGTR